MGSGGVYDVPESTGLGYLSTKLPETSTKEQMKISKRRGNIFSISTIKLRPTHVPRYGVHRHQTIDRRWDIEKDYTEVESHGESKDNGFGGPFFDFNLRIELAGQPVWLPLAQDISLHRYACALMLPGGGHSLFYISFVCLSIRRNTKP